MSMVRNTKKKPRSLQAYILRKKEREKKKKKKSQQRSKIGQNSSTML